MAAKKSTTKENVIHSNSPRKISVTVPKSINMVYVLGLLLIIASFLIGMLFTKVQYLENGGSNVLSATDDNIDDGSGSTAPIGPVDVEVGNLPIIGDKDAKLTIVEFSDFQCPFCKSFYDETLSQIKKEYVDTGKAKFAFRHYPLTSIHPNAQKAAEAAECANAQGNFWDYHDELFKNQAEWEALDSTAAQTKFAEYATTIGLNGETLAACVSSGEMADKVKKDLDDGTAAGVDGTPATFINGMMISGAAPYTDFKAEIDKQLSEAK